MAKVWIEESTLTEICDAIRAKKETTEAIPVPNIASEIESMTTGGGGVQPQLNSPTLSRNGSTITITNPSSNGGFVDLYNIYEGENLLVSQDSKTYDLSGFEYGEHILQATVSGANFIESEKSAELNASKYSVTINLANVTSDSEITYCFHGDSVTFTITANDGFSLPNEVTATMGGESVDITYSNSTGQITISNVTGDLIINVTGIAPSLANDTWETIVSRANDGTYANYYTVGEEKDVELSNGETITMVLVGMNHDVDSEGNAIPLSFVAKNLLATTMAIDSSATYHTTYNSSDLDYYLRNTVIGYFPSIIKNNIKSARKSTGSSASTEGYPTSGMLYPLWIPSGREVGLSLTSGYYFSAGNVYEYYNGDDSESLRMKRLGDTDTVTAWWITDAYWLPGVQYNCQIKADGTRGSSSAKNTIGVCIGFCL